MDDVEYSFYHNKCGKHTFRYKSTESNVPPLPIFECVLRVLQDIDDVNNVALPILRWFINCDGTGAIFVDNSTNEEKKLLGADKDQSKFFTMFKNVLVHFFTSYLTTKAHNRSLPYLLPGVQCTSRICDAQSLDDIKQYIADMIHILRDLEAVKVGNTS